MFLTFPMQSQTEDWNRGGHCLPPLWGPRLYLRADWGQEKIVAIGFSVQLGLALVTRQEGFFRIILASVVKRSCRNLRPASTFLRLNKQKNTHPARKQECFPVADHTQAAMPSYLLIPSGFRPHTFRELCWPI